MKALITSGGRGTRLRPITHTKNKHLIPIANKPMLAYAIESVAEAGISEVGIITNADSQDVQETFGNGESFGVQITYIPQEAPLGLAHVVKIAQDFINNEPFLFYLGDNMLVGGVKKFIDSFNKQKSNCHLTLAKVKDPQRFGVPDIQDGRILGIEEKPENPKSDFAVTGLYIYDQNIFEAVNAISPSARGELEISDAHQYLLDNGYKITYSEITGWWKDTGKPIDLLAANRLVLDHQKAENNGSIDKKSVISGNVRIGENTSVQNSVIRGPAIIGDNCDIRDSYIGPFTSIDDESTIIHSEIEFSIILKRCQINDVGFRIEESLLGTEVEIVKSKRLPKTNRFMLADHSRIEVS
jgi:glucose-1-phosphate thymidylyltransferase